MSWQEPRGVGMRGPRPQPRCLYPVAAATWFRRGEAAGQRGEKQANSEAPVGAHRPQWGRSTGCSSLRCRPARGGRNSPGGCVFSTAAPVTSPRCLCGPQGSFSRNCCDCWWQFRHSEKSQGAWSGQPPANDFLFPSLLTLGPGPTNTRAALAW